MTKRRGVLMFGAGAFFLVAGLTAFAVQTGGDRGEDDSESSSKEDATENASGFAGALSGVPLTEDTSPVQEVDGPPELPDGPPQYGAATQTPPATVSEAEAYAGELTIGFSQQSEVIACGITAAGELITAQMAAEKPVPGRIASAPAELQLYVCAVDLGSEVAAAIFPAEPPPHDISSVWRTKHWQDFEHIPNLPIP